MTRTKPILLAAFAIAGLAAVTTGATLATAASPAGPTIEKRQANFKKMGGAMKVLKDELGGSADKAKMAAAAKTIAAMARVQVKLFPAGTGPSSGVKTKALANIWTDRAQFDAAGKKLIAESDKLVAATASGNADAIGAQFKAVGGACGGCHRQFRAED